MNDHSNINYDESKIPHYILPELLKFPDGHPITTIDQWQYHREHLINLFQQEMYGRTPDASPVTAELIESDDNVFDGLGRRRQIKLTLTTTGTPITVTLLVYLPNRCTQPGLFLGLNFFGNQATTNDPAVSVTQSWIRKIDQPWFNNHHATEASRGYNMHRWQVQTVLKNGWGLATAYYGDICPDDSEGFYKRLTDMNLDSAPDKHDITAIGLWAWGLMRIMDILEQFDEINPTRVVVMGHSRLGKTALWAGVQDPRFAAVISNDSGCGGAALTRRNVGESVEVITSTFNHWFCPKFRQYAGKEEKLPIDQHMLLALMAPRPLLITSALDDRWADPKGEFLSAHHASEVYKLYGFDGITESIQPPLMTLTGDRVCYHIRPGQHNVTAEDWNAFLTFVRRNQLSP